MRRSGLYDPANEHDSCGVGFVAKVDGTPSHEIIREGITVLINLVHRGAVGGDLKTGDGAGMTMGLPHEFFRHVTADLGFHLPGESEYGAGMLFVPRTQNKRAAALRIVEQTVRREGGEVLGWREVPVKPDSLGDSARATMPDFRQVFLVFPGLRGDELERKLYVTRKCMEAEAREYGLDIEDFYVCSLSTRIIVYKGLFVAPQFAGFYPDLEDPRLQSCFSLVHQRYSTNTSPSWPLAQPFRYVAHNGEINALRGNINWMNARENTMSSPLFGDDITKLIPVVTPGMSDSAVFDQVLELLVNGGRSIAHAMMMMVPEAFGQRYHISADKRAFYEYHAAIMEPWDGPAAISFTDGVRIGAILDRNGLRPARYTITNTGKVVLASEAGVLDIPSDQVLSKGRLAPGKILLVDTEQGRVLYDNEIKSTVSRRQQYRRWVEENEIVLRGLFGVPGPVEVEHESLKQRQRIFGYTREDVRRLILPMAVNAQEPVGSMGNDVALAVLSTRPRLLYDYFKQLFAQVTNPPIDPYRENLVMSTMSFIGRERNLLAETPEHCRQIKLQSPVLSNEDVTILKNTRDHGIHAEVLPMVAGAAERDLERVIEALCRRAEESITAGATILILSDRTAGPDLMPIPALLAVSAVHHHLIRSKKRHLAALVVETAEAREVMHFATLSSYGASAVNPYLAFETIADLGEGGELPDGLDVEGAIENYITAVKKGLLKIMSKMGISTIRSYRGAQVFEAIGLSSSMVQRYFTGTPSRIGGITTDQLSQEMRRRHAAAFAPGDTEGLDSGGIIHLRRDSEQHLLTPEAVVLLQRAVREEDYDRYREYSREIRDTSRHLCTLRGLFTFKERAPVPLDEIEPEESILKRFVTPAMSFGSISKEAHETMAVAMNRLGAGSNSGEGGEDEERFIPLPNGDSRRSEIKQVASARFGVTSNYLVNCRELQIKIAQGAKPGEGGQLPGYKVDETIARVRHSTPGVMLISPPPHHDIYSIEDLAQLIFDLKNANPRARVSVKLVSEVGVGTVAAGVAKGKADMVLISGYDGGTGASPISSIMHAGIPWEIGLAEAQQTLVGNGLRDRIRVQVDGQMRTGRDVVIAALLGAEEYGFGTVTLVTMGCVMMRKCHLNTCPVGVATQDPELRAKFRGKPEHVMAYFRFVAREARELMAELGFRTIDEMIGQADVLDVRAAVDHWKACSLDLSRLMVKADVPEGGSLRCTKRQELDYSGALDPRIITEAAEALDGGKPVRIEMEIRNRNRAVGATLSSEVSRRYGSQGLPDGTITCGFTGSAGQSFGAFLAAGITFELEGEANDYTGKGLSGGRIVISPPAEATFRSELNIITGNVNLFGATAGEMFVAGMAGERFAVRNSGATAVVEGVGDHGCEYMTGGCVVVLGRTGVNFAAGMSGGMAFVLDEDQLFDTKCNLEMVDVEAVTGESEKLRTLIERHIGYTGSEYASRIVEHWTEMQPMFVQVVPIDYRKALERMREEETTTADSVAVTEEVYR